MAVSVTINGTSYSIPSTADEQWGDNVTSWIQAASQYLLQRNGGVFTLSADVDFGGSAGLLAKYFTSRTTNAGTTGVLRLANNESIVWRNAAGLTDLALKVTASDVLQFNGGTFLISSGTINANTALIANGSSQIASSAVTSTELGYVSGVTSAIQTQLDAKLTSLTGDVTTSGSGAAAATIASNAVTNAKLAQMATLTVKGNNTGGTANAADLTVAQLSTMLARQQVIGTPVTTQVTSTSTSFASLSTTIAVSITPNRTGTYRVYGSFPTANSVLNSSTQLRINPTVGSPTVLFSQEVFLNEDSAGNIKNQDLFALYTLTASTAYTFVLEMKVSAASTGTVRGDAVSNGVALVVQEL